MSEPRYSMAVVGATGLVGAEIVRILEERELPLASLSLYASERSAGEVVIVGGRRITVELLDRSDFGGVDVVFFAASEAVSAEWVGRATTAGAVAIDLSQLTADDPTVPLVVPEVNAAAVGEYPPRLTIASPGAAAIQLAVVLKPLRDVAGLKRVVVSSYHPASAAGRAGVEALGQQTVELLNGHTPELAVFPHRMAFNLLPQVGELLAGGHTRSELQLVGQVRRLLGEARLAISATSVLVPLFYGLSQSVNVETDTPLSVAAARDLLHGAPGVLLHDDPSSAEYPTPGSSLGTDAACVGRIRRDESVPCGLELWVASDNLRRGCAGNAVAIAEVLIRDHLSKQRSA